MPHPSHPPAHTAAPPAAQAHIAPATIDQLNPTSGQAHQSHTMRAVISFPTCTHGSTTSSSSAKWGSSNSIDEHSAPHCCSHCTVQVPSRWEVWVGGEVQGLAMAAQKAGHGGTRQASRAVPSRCALREVQDAPARLLPMQSIPPLLYLVKPVGHQAPGDGNEGLSSDHLLACSGYIYQRALV